MAQIFVNGVEGLLSATLTSGGSTMQGSFLADLPDTSGGFIVLTIDPDEVYNEAEVVHVDGHSAGSTSANIVRAQEGTFQPASWPIGTKVVAGVTAGSLDQLQTDIEVASAAGPQMDISYRVGSSNTGELFDGAIVDDTVTFAKPAGWSTYTLAVTLHTSAYTSTLAGQVRARLRYDDGSTVTTGPLVAFFPGVYDGSQSGQYSLYQVRSGLSTNISVDIQIVDVQGVSEPVNLGPGRVYQLIAYKDS